MLGLWPGESNGFKAATLTNAYGGSLLELKFYLRLPGHKKNNFWITFRPTFAPICLFNFLCILFSDASTGNGILTKATVPIYATGVLTCYNQVWVLNTH